MDEKRMGSDEAELKQPDEAIKDLEPDAQEGEGIQGGAIDSYIKLDSNLKI